MNRRVQRLFFSHSFTQARWQCHMYEKGTALGYVYSFYRAKRTFDFNLGGSLLIPRPTNAEKIRSQAVVDSVWIMNMSHYMHLTMFMHILLRPFTGTTTGPIGCTPGVIAGVAVGCLSLSLLLTAASVVITFLCTRRCYNKKSSPPSPNERSVYYETVQSDSVQMQPSPAYQSVEQVKWTCCICTCKLSRLTIA